MATPAQYQALTDAQLAARRSQVVALPDSPSKSAELALIDAEIERRRTSTASGYNPGDGSGGVLSGLSSVVGSATAPLHEVSNTSMWTAIGIAAAAVAVIAIAAVVAYGFHRV